MNDEDEHEPEHEDDEEEDEELELMMMMMMGTRWVLNGLAIFRISTKFQNVNQISEFQPNSQFFHLKLLKLLKGRFEASCPLVALFIRKWGCFSDLFFQGTTALFGPTFGGDQTHVQFFLCKFCIIIKAYWQRKMDTKRLCSVNVVISAIIHLIIFSFV